MYQYISERIIEYDGDKYIYHDWEIDRPHYFKGCNPKELFPTIIKLYLDKYSLEEKSKIENGGYCLRTKFLSSDEKSVVSTGLVNVDGFNDPFIKDLLNSLPEQLIGLEINLGPYMHLFVMEKESIFKRSLDNDFIFDNNLSYKGMVLLGRDTYEYEEDFERIIDEQNIFLIRDNKLYFNS